MGNVRLRGDIRIGLARAVVNGRVGSWRLLCYGFEFGGLIIAGRGVVMIGIVIMILVVIAADRRRSGCWLDEIRVGLLFCEFRPAMQRILV